MKKTNATNGCYLDKNATMGYTTYTANETMRSHNSMKGGSDMRENIDKLLDLIEDERLLYRIYSFINRLFVGEAR